MDVNAIVDVVNNVGFPIMCCIGLAYYINSTLKELTKVMSEHTTVLKKLTTIIEQHCVDGK